MVYGDPLFSLRQFNAQYVGKLSSYSNQVLCDFGPHQTRCVSSSSTRKIRSWTISTATRAPSIVLSCALPRYSVRPSYAIVQVSSSVEITIAKTRYVRGE